MTVACPLCASENTTHIDRNPEVDQNMRRCADCSFHFVDPHRPWIPSVTDSVAAETFTFWGNEAAHAAYARWREEENDRIAAIVMAAGAHERLLEIGFGEGPLTRRLLPQVKQYWGIEPVPNHFRSTIDELGLDPARCLCTQAETMLDDIRLAERRGTFDAIVMISVLEHLSHPREVLEACHALLRPGGRLFISTPDSTFFPLLTVVRRLGRIEPWSRFHISFFSRHCLERAFDRAGFSVASRQSHSLLVSASVEYYKQLKNSPTLGALMTAFRFLGIDRMLRVSTLFYCLVKN